MDVAVRIPTPVVEHDGRRPERCDRCGSQGFNLHQRATKALKDPLTLRADVIRFICKRCRKTTRLYPPGVDSARQTVALRQSSVMLYWLGLSYLAVRATLADLGCALSCTSIRRNVADARQATGWPPASSRLDLQSAGDGVLRGRDGLVCLRLEQATEASRFLLVEIAPGPNAAHLRWRLHEAVGWLARAN